MSTQKYLSSEVKKFVGQEMIVLQIEPGYDIKGEPAETANFVTRGTITDVSKGYVTLTGKDGKYQFKFAVKEINRLQTGEFKNGRKYVTCDSYTIDKSGYTTPKPVRKTRKPNAKTITRKVETQQVAQTESIITRFIRFIW